MSVICGMALCSFAAAAPRTPTGAQKPSGPRDQAVATAVMASRLAGYAREQADPLAWLMASRLLRNSAPGTQDAAGQTLSESWLDEAGRAAGGNPAISGLIQDAKASVTRGVLEGPAQTAGRLVLALV